MDSQAPAAPSLITSRAARLSLLLSCLFGTIGVVMVYLPRWLEGERGLSGAEIGAVLSLAQLARVLTGPAIAFWADGAADRRTPMKIIALAAIAAYAAFFFLAHDFISLLALGFIALSLTQAISPLAEAATLRATAQGKITYGVARGIGSLSFIIANVAGGALIARFGLVAVVVWVLSGLALSAASAWFTLLADPPSPAARRAQGRTQRFAAIGTLLRNRRFLVLIFACGLIQSAHAFYYGFSTLVWRGQGMADEMVGVLWGFSVAVEVAFLWSLAPIERRVSPEIMILLGAAGGVLRWTLMGFAPLGIWLWPIQALHTLSFAATHVGAMRLLFRETPEASAAMAQTLYSVISAGVLMGASTLLSGLLYDVVGARGYWAMAGLTCAGGALALLLLGPAPRRPQATLS
jgi:MFS transporter, PPP family, 3-phenylpropionic acid transporter